MRKATVLVLAAAVALGASLLSCGPAVRDVPSCVESACARASDCPAVSCTCPGAEPVLVRGCIERCCETNPEIVCQRFCFGDAGM